MMEKAHSTVALMARYSTYFHSVVRIPEGFNEGSILGMLPLGCDDSEGTLEGLKEGSILGMLPLGCDDSEGTLEGRKEGSILGMLPLGWAEAEGMLDGCKEGPEDADGLPLGFREEKLSFGCEDCDGCKDGSRDDNVADGGPLGAPLGLRDDKLSLGCADSEGCKEGANERIRGEGPALGSREGINSLGCEEGAGAELFVPLDAKAISKVWLLVLVVGMSVVLEMPAVAVVWLVTLVLLVVVVHMSGLLGAFEGGIGTSTNTSVGALEGTISTTVFVVFVALVFVVFVLLVYDSAGVRDSITRDDCNASMAALACKYPYPVA
jgi:hypothetical protein